MYETLLDFIENNYGSAHRIVEVGVGRRLDHVVQLAHRLPRTTFVATDWDSTVFGHVSPNGVKLAVDDVFHPRLPVYEGANLLYAIHPPLELVPAIQGISDRIGADVLVVPLAGERDGIRGPGWVRFMLDPVIVGWRGRRPVTKLRGVAVAANGGH